MIGTCRYKCIILPLNVALRQAKKQLVATSGGICFGSTEVRNENYNGF